MFKCQIVSKRHIILKCKILFVIGSANHFRHPGVQNLPPYLGVVKLRSPSLGSNLTFYHSKSASSIHAIHKDIVRLC